MKPVLAMSLIVAALFAGFVGATAAVVLGVGASSSAEHATAVPAPNAAVRETALHKGDSQNELLAAESVNLHRQVDDLSTQVTTLRGELDGLRSEIARQATPSAVPVAVAKLDEVSAIQHDAVIKILEEQKQLEQAKRDEERKARDQQQIKDRAARAAKELGLGAADETRLVDFMTVASTKRDEMFASTRDGNFDRDTMRKSFEDYRTWTETELKAQFGPDLAAQLLKLQRDGRGGDFGGGGPPGGWTGQQQGGPGQTNQTGTHQGGGQGRGQ